MVANLVVGERVRCRADVVHDKETVQRLFSQKITAGTALSKLYLFGVIQGKEQRKWIIEFEGEEGAGVTKPLAAKSLDRVRLCLRHPSLTHRVFIADSFLTHLSLISHSSVCVCVCVSR
jgi:hypothetical protein